MEKLRILFLCQQPLWPCNTGARLRNFHLANALGAHCEVTVLQAVAPAETPAPATASSFKNSLFATRDRSYTPIKILRGLAGPLPVTVLNYLSSNVERVLAETLESTPFDAVQIESIHMAPYLETVRRCAKHQPLALLDWHNIESELLQQYARKSSNPARKFVAARSQTLLHQVEDNALLAFSAHSVVSELDRKKLLQRAPNAKVHLIPNGVDTTAFAPSGQDHSGRTLLFVGSMDYHANFEAVIWFCREVWPQLAAQFPDMQFKIVGRNPPAAVKSLTNSRIVVTGTVKDVRPYYREAFAVLVPLRVGGGTRLKILEAMAAGVPVISTRLGAEGIMAEHNKQILLADTPTDMVAAVQALVTQPNLATGLRESALELVRTHYDWSALGLQLLAVYQSLSLT